MNERCIDNVAERSRRYNLDDLIETFVDWDPIQIRKKLIKLYIFTTNAAMHTDYLREEDIEAIEMLQQIVEAMENIEHPKEALLVVRVK